MVSINVLNSFLNTSMKMATPLLLGALGEIIVERAGVMNIAIEGIFLVGAWGGFVGAYVSHSLLIGLLVAIAASVVVGLVYGFLTITLKLNQIIAGTGLNILNLGLTIFLYRTEFGIPTAPLKVQIFRDLSIPLISKIPLLNQLLSSQNILTYLVLLCVPVVHIFLFHTRFGLNLRSVGENPEAADSAGINVARMRFFAVIIASILSGLAGAFYSIGYLGIFTGDMIAGRGWIAFAVTFFSNWAPIGALWGSLMFGAISSLSILFLTMGIKAIPNELILALPYIVTIVATMTRKSLRAPKALGEPFRKEE
ncbi:MAG TPA: ABC transporter permease [Desulfuromonadaceae bacterium]